MTSNEPPVLIVQECSLGLKSLLQYPRERKTFATFKCLSGLTKLQIPQHLYLAIPECHLGVANALLAGMETDCLIVIALIALIEFY